MAHLLRITDGSTTVNLTGGTISQRNYALRSPEQTVQEADAGASYDGGEVRSVTYRNVTESVEVTLLAATSDLVRTELRTLEGLFLQAARYQKERKGSRVYVEFQPGASGDIYRSEILMGRVEPGAEALGWQWYAPGMEALVAWRRRYYWEGPEVELPLANGGGSGTGGRTVYHHDDAGAGHDNWVSIAGANVTGVLPAPVRLEITNSYNSADLMGSILLGHNVFSNPGSFQQVLEAESVSYSAGGLSNTADGNSSGGYYRRATWNSQVAQIMYRWALDSAFLANARGNWFRAIGRLANVLSNAVQVQVKIRYPSVDPGNTVFENAQTMIGYSTRFIDFGVVQIPPWLPGETSLEAVALELWGKADGTINVDLDCLFLMTLDGWRELRVLGSPGWAYQKRVVDDAIGGRVWVDSGTATAKAGLVYSMGRPLMLIPGHDQRIYWLSREPLYAWTIARTASIRAYFRPRRLTL